MHPVYKFLLFFSIGAVFLILSWLVYRFFQAKMQASRRSSSFLLYALLLLLCNALLLLAGFFVVLRAYGFLSQNM